MSGGARTETSVNYIGGTFILLLIIAMSGCGIYMRAWAISEDIDRIAVALERAK